tara:strand:- start:1482 stop:2462 length:981 start_codon:yes stop_codon:yes gene_type:complete
MKVHVAGFGSWGIAFSNLLAKQNADVTILTTNFEDPEAFNNTKLHPLFKGLKLQKNIKAASKKQDLGKPDLLVWAVPTKFTKQWLNEDFVKRYSNVDILVLSKGLSPEGFDPIGNWLNHYLKNDIYILSGPNFATEIIHGMPAATVIAGEKRPASIERIMKTSSLRTYYSNDILGVSLGGILKNVYAIGSGMVDGANLGKSARAAMISRALVEMSRVFEHFNANKETLWGLAGLGDLILTATGKDSKNWQLGNQIAKGLSLEDALDNLTGESEGIRTLKGLIELSEKTNVDIPLACAINNVIHKEHTVKDAVKDLLQRPSKKTEIE